MSTENSERLPDDLEQIMKLIAGKAAAYRNRLQAAEVGKLKGDMMNMRHRWSADRAPIGLIRQRLSDLGMTQDDIETVVDLVKRTQAGRRLVPNRFYKDSKFKPPVT